MPPINAAKGIHRTRSPMHECNLTEGWEPPTTHRWLQCCDRYVTDRCATRLVGYAAGTPGGNVSKLRCAVVVHETAENLGQHQHLRQRPDAARSTRSAFVEPVHSTTSSLRQPKPVPTSCEERPNPVASALIRDRRSRPPIAHVEHGQVAEQHAGPDRVTATWIRGAAWCGHGVAGRIEAGNRAP
jgi:hypothetical protein